MSNTKTSSSLKTLCRTAIFLALLIAVQFVTRSMCQYVTCLLYTSDAADE